MTREPNRPLESDEIDELVADALDTLPQIDAIGSQRLRHWLDQVETVAPGTAEWHLRRQHGFGGSEAGALVQSWRGEHHPFSSAHDIVKQKLCLVPPDPEEDATRRGHQAETLVRSLFEAEYGEPMNLQRDGNASVRIGSTGVDDHPWLVATPDELYRMPDGGHWLVDFKAPRPDILMDYRRQGLPIDYRAQLLHYAMVADRADIDVQRMSVVLFDYDRWSVEVMDVGPEPELAQDLLDAGDAYWSECVLKDQVPKFAGPRAFTVEDAPSDIKAAADRFVASKRMEQRAKDIASESRKQIESWARRTGLIDGSKIRVNDAQMTDRIDYDPEALVNRLRDIGVSETRIEQCRRRKDLDGNKYAPVYADLRQAALDLVNGKGDTDTLRQIVEEAPEPPKSQGKLDPEALASLLKQHGERPDRYTARRIETALPRGQAPDLIERRARADAITERAVGEILSVPEHNSQPSPPQQHGPQNGADETTDAPAPTPGPSGGLEDVL